MRNEKGALHLEVLSAMPGRIRFQLEKPIKSDVPFLGIKGVTRCRYNPRIGTLLCEYDQLTVTEEQLLVKKSARFTRGWSARRCCTSSIPKRKEGRWRRAAIWRCAALRWTDR